MGLRILGAPHSLVLRSSLWASAVPDSNFDAATANQAHHIVEANDRHAQHARMWLANAGVDIDSAVNGVFLPVAHNDDTGEATVHVGSHLPGYAQAVNRQLENAIDAAFGAGAATFLLANPCPPALLPMLHATVINVLNRIRTLLLTQALQINKGYNVDEDYDPDAKDRDRPDTKRGGYGGGRAIGKAFISALG